jgi:AraC-like DNA-binding protein
VQFSVNPIVTQAVVHPEGLIAAIRSASLEPCQLSSSSLASRIARVSCPNVCLDFVDLGPAMLFKGVMPADCYSLIFVTECPTAGRSFNFSYEHQDGYMGFFPPGGQVDAFTPPGYANATLTIPSTEFHLAIERGYPEISGNLLKHGAGMRIGPSEQSHLRALLSAVTEGIQDSTGPLTSLLARRELETQLLDAFISALRSGANHLVAKPNLRMTGRLKHLRQARDFIKETAPDSINSEDLRNALGMSPRGVEVLFRSSFGITPNAFIRCQRLHGARRELLAASATPGKVSEVALRWGFWHMGHFSANYRSLFGESPTHTVRRAT